MRLLCVLVIVVVCWDLYAAMVLPFMSKEDPQISENTRDDSDMTQSLHICDLIEAVMISSILDIQNSQNYPNPRDPSTENLRSQKQYKDDTLANFHFLDRQRKQAQIGYNVNSFGLRFGKRASKLNWKLIRLGFGQKKPLNIPMSTLHELFCSE